MSSMSPPWKYSGNKFVYIKQVLLRQTNVFGNTYFLNYIEWQGEAREKFLLEHPKSRDFMMANQGVKLITHSLYHHFKENTYFGDSVQIEVTCKSILKYSFILVFEYYNVQSNNLLGTGWQKIGFWNNAKNTIAPIPDLFFDLLVPVLRNS